MRAWIAAGLVAGVALGGCASGSQSSNRSGVVTAVQKPDGSFVAVDENGNEVNSTEAELMIALLEAMRRSGGEPLAEEQIWRGDEDGNFTHIQSGGVCPAMWKDFFLNKKTIHRQDGTDVSCNYLNDQASFTFYFYRNSQSREEEAEQIIEMVGDRFPGGKPVDILTTPSSYSLVARGFVHNNSRGEKRREAVMLADSEGWRLKLRMSYDDTTALDLESRANLMLIGQADRVYPLGTASLTPDSETSDAPEI